jgi:N-sulfoglucosamine sulfohydrolase
MQNTRRAFLKQAGSLPLFLRAAYGRQGETPASRPNILWIIAEDFCPELGCYGNSEVRTPNIDRLATQGRRFTQAFTTSPVCSASRSALMTGMYQTSIGAHHHRSHRDDGFRLPAGVKPITELFREAGYFTANVRTAAEGVSGTGKTDLNFTIDAPIFDGSDWNQRQPGQPFYAQINLPETHRRFTRNEQSPTDPNLLNLPPQYPDHPITRADWAAYYDTIEVLDAKVSAILRRVEEEGLEEDTIVFFFGDNGRPHVRGKQWLYDEGIHVPLIVRWPGILASGTVDEQLVSAIDLSATSLGLAGIPLPEKMEGQPFLGEEARRPRTHIVAARDRCDETIDRIRCIRTSRFKYIRNFRPERPYSQLNRYKETEYPVMRLMRRLHSQDRLAPAQARFMAPDRPFEELYDLERDPDEVRNLANSPDHCATLTELATALGRWILETGDQGEIPEDPAIALFYEQAAKKNYDERLRRLYREEGMEVPSWLEGEESSNMD